MKKIIILFTLIALIFISGCSKGAYNVNPTDNKGHVEVAIQDQDTRIIDLRLSQFIANLTLLDNYSINDYYINISSTTPPTTAYEVCLKEGTEFYQGEILQVTSLGGNNYQLLLDKPLDYAYTTAGGCSLRNTDWAVAGSLGNPITFSVSPAKLENVSWDITRIILTCIGDGAGASNDAPDLSTFFTMNAITNGIVFRTVDGETVNIFNAKDNFHLNSEAYDLAIYPKSRAGLFGVAVRRSFNGPDKNGVVIRLDSETSDSFELIVRDDLTDMTECHAVVQGHEVDR